MPPRSDSSGTDSPRQPIRDAQRNLINALEDLHGAESILLLRNGEKSAAPGMSLEHAERRVGQALKEIKAARTAWKRAAKKSSP